MNQGSILLCSNGDYWQAVYTDALGERRKRGLGSKRKVTRAAAMAKIGRLARELNLEASGGVPSIAELGARAIERRRGIKPATVELLERTAELLRLWAAECLPGKEHTRIDEVSKSDASNFGLWLEEKGRSGDLGRTIKASTRTAHLLRARSLWNYVIDDSELAIVNPFARRKWKRERVAQDWTEVTPEMMAKLLAAAGAAKHEGIRNALALARWAGLRSGECRRLRWRDVDLSPSARMLTVIPEEDDEGLRREGTKQRVRHVPIRPELAALLAESNSRRAGTPERAPNTPRLRPKEAPKPDPDAPVCPDLPAKRLMHRALVGGKQGTQRRADGEPVRYEGLIVKAGLVPWKRPMHTLRKCAGTQWVSEGFPITDVARWMGNSVAVAAEYYVRTTPTTWQRAIGLGRDESPVAPQSAPQKVSRPKAAGRKHRENKGRPRSSAG